MPAPLYLGTIGLYPPASSDRRVALAHNKNKGKTA
jgi:hypothetical protein